MKYNMEFNPGYKSSKSRNVNAEKGMGRGKILCFLFLSLFLLLIVAGCSGKVAKMPASEPSLAVKTAADDYFKMTAEDSEKTRYYSYDVDLNGDGIDEVMLVMAGMYTSGSGGDSMLILEPCAADNKTEYRVRQDFTLIRLPLAIADVVEMQPDAKKKSVKPHNSYKDIYLRAGGGGAPYRFVKLSADAKGMYCGVNDAEEISEEQMKKIKIKYYLTEE